MKTKIFLLFIFCFFVSTSHLYSTDTIKVLSVIKEKYLEYNKTIQKCSIKKYDITGESTEGGSLIFYIDNKKVKKLLQFYMVSLEKV
ncbi:hypothetical protein RDV77_06125 [Porphyromonadaceae sp. NP-X]|jgi:hypothetical protein|nr:hypothetical protein [Porphyromonadaceae sp. NP-X]